MERSEQINDLATALCKAQGDLKAAPYDSTNPAFRSKYASLASFQETYRPVLAKYGLSLIQTVESDGEGHFVSSMLLHTTGQFLSCRMRLILQKNDMQGLGSATTYAKRYQASAMLGISADEDDDGNAASGPSAPAYKPKPQNFAPKAASVEDIDRALGIKSKGTSGDFVMQTGKYQGRKVRDLTPKELNALIDHVNKAAPNDVPPEVQEFASHGVEWLVEQSGKK